VRLARVALLKQAKGAFARPAAPAGGADRGLTIGSGELAVAAFTSARRPGKTDGAGHRIHPSYVDTECHSAASKRTRDR
jgi:hypothetical protein